MLTLYLRAFTSDCVSVCVNISAHRGANQSQWSRLRAYARTENAHEPTCNDERTRLECCSKCVMVGRAVRPVGSVGSIEVQWGGMDGVGCLPYNANGLIARADSFGTTIPCRQSRSDPTTATDV